VRFLVLLSASLLSLTMPVASRPDDPGVAVIRRMHDRYASTWYHSLTFEQKTTHRAPDGHTTIETWYETGRFPGTLRIDRAPLADGNGALMTADSTFIIEHGAVSKRNAGGNPLVPLLFDVYVVPVDQSVSTLRAAGYDFAKTHTEMWQGRPTTVVGADSGDLKTAQFWIDTERLVVVRMLGPSRPGSPRILDARFNDYQPLAGGWISPVCEFYFDGTLRQREEYSDIKADPPLDPALFDPAHWTTAKHWAAH
jgi:hypothetical protein